MKKYLLVKKNKLNISYEIFNFKNDLTSFEMELIAKHYCDCLKYEWYCIDNFNNDTIGQILLDFTNFLKKSL